MKKEEEIATESVIDVEVATGQSDGPELRIWLKPTIYDAMEEEARAQGMTIDDYLTHCSIVLMLKADSNRQSRASA